MPRPAVVKKIWEYVRLHNLQDPSNKRYIICDDKLQAVFKKKRVECFGMNRLLSEHLGSMEEMADGSESSPPTEAGEKEPFDGSSCSTITESPSSLEGKDDRKNGIRRIEPLISSEGHVNWVM